MFLVVWTTRLAEGEYDEYEDHWIAHESYVDAEATFEDLIKLDDVHSATICQPVKSTEAHYVVEGL